MSKPKLRIAVLYDQWVESEPAPATPPEEAPRPRRGKKPVKT